MGYRVASTITMATVAMATFTMATTEAAITPPPLPRILILFRKRPVAPNQWEEPARKVGGPTRWEEPMRGDPSQGRRHWMGSHQ